MTPMPAASSHPMTGMPLATFACIHLARSDRVRIMGFPDNVVPAIQEAIARVWMSGIQRAGGYEYGGYEWKLSGNPCECFY